MRLAHCERDVRGLCGTSVAQTRLILRTYPDGYRVDSLRANGDGKLIQTSSATINEIDVRETLALRASPAAVWVSALNNAKRLLMQPFRVKDMYKWR